MGSGLFSTDRSMDERRNLIEDGAINPGLLIRNEERNLVNSLNRVITRRTLYGLVLGQILSLLITGTGISTNYLAHNFGVRIPTTQSLANYVFLALVYGIIFLRRGESLKVKWYWYLLISIADVEANAVVVKSYQYTSIAMVFLLDCFVIPCVMMYTWLFPKIHLKVSYNYLHFFGVFISLCGVFALVIGDAAALGGLGSGWTSALGDVLVLVSAALYAASNVGQESIVKQYNHVEFLAMLGIFGTAISAVQACLLEWDGILQIEWNTEIILLLLGFVACLWSLYSIAPFVLRWCSATVMNMSLLTSDVFGLVAGVYLFNFQPSILYAVGFAAVIVGIIVYNLRPVKYID